jgi:hypothetical protein
MLQKVSKEWLDRIGRALEKSGKSFEKAAEDLDKGIPLDATKMDKVFRESNKLRAEIDRTLLGAKAKKPAAAVKPKRKEAGK